MRVLYRACLLLIPWFRCQWVHRQSRAAAVARPPPGMQFTLEFSRERCWDGALGITFVACVPCADLQSGVEVGGFERVRGPLACSGAAPVGSRLVSVNGRSVEGWPFESAVQELYSARSPLRACFCVYVQSD